MNSAEPGPVLKEGPTETGRARDTAEPYSAGPPVPLRSFRIGFDPRDRQRVLRYWDEILSSQRWTEGPFVNRFEEKWAEWNGLSAVATSSWAGAAMACMEYFGLKGKKVLCPTNTFAATPLAILKSGATVVFGDCNREDLCLSFDEVKRAADNQEIAAVWLVHIGGHIAFDVHRIAEFCRSRNIVLLEDCAHAHGAEWNGRKPGTWGDAGVYSFYATKTISTGEGGILVSRHEGLIEFAKKYRNYGKPDYTVQGLNFRMCEFAAALGLVQVERMRDIVEWKNEMAQRVLDPIYSKRVRLPEGMISGLYKYVVFEPVENGTGRVYDQPAHSVLGYAGSFPNSEWVASNHWCVPLYYHPAPEWSKLPVASLPQASVHPVARPAAASRVTGGIRNKEV